MKAVSHEANVRMWLLTEVGKLVRDIDAKKTIANDEEMKFTCRAIIAEHPTLKMEELVIVFNEIRMGKFGKLFERLKTAEILECIRQYEGNVRAEVIERQQHQMKVAHNAPSDRKLAPLNLAALLDDATEPVPQPKQGIGTRLGIKNGWV